MTVSDLDTRQSGFSRIPGTAQTASPSKLRAIKAPLEPLLVLAGPGAGKTFCLIERIRFLIEEKNIDPERILAFTFTNRAAEEIASRLTHVGLRGEILEEEGLEAAGSTEGRVRTMQAALRVWSLHPVFGVGIGNFNTERAVTDPFGTVGPPHDSYLWALSEGGLFALILYLGFFWWVFKKIRGIEWEYQARFGPVDLGWMVSAMRCAVDLCGRIQLTA